MKNLTTISWSEAIEVHKNQKKEDKKFETEYEKLVEDAYNFLMANLATDPERPAVYFEDAWTMYGVEPDDLINRLI